MISNPKLSPQLASKLLAAGIDPKLDIAGLLNLVDYNFVNMNLYKPGVPFQFLGSSVQFDTTENAVAYILLKQPL